MFREKMNILSQQSQIEGVKTENREARSLECGPFLHFLDSLEEQKWHCF